MIRSFVGGGDRVQIWCLFSTLLCLAGTWGRSEGGGQGGGWGMVSTGESIGGLLGNEDQGLHQVAWLPSYASAVARKPSWHGVPVSGLSDSLN
jgi:hypothetical protein